MSGGRNSLTLITIVMATTLTVSAAGETNKPGVYIQNGFFDGRAYLNFSPLEQQRYVAGLLDGIFIAPLFGAPDDGARYMRLRNCVTGMSDIQLSAIFVKYLKEHPEEWHRYAHTVMFQALNAVCKFPD